MTPRMVREERGQISDCERHSGRCFGVKQKIPIVRIRGRMVECRRRYDRYAAAGANAYARHLGLRLPDTGDTPFRVVKSHRREPPSMP
jgi:hypothetical protein